MLSRRARRLGGVLHNFLGTFTSRYSERDGYWLFGFLTQEALREADLLQEGPADDVAKLARLRFRSQLANACGIGQIDSAMLHTVRQEAAERIIDGRMRSGYMFSVAARARIGLEEVVREMRIFVAPHDPRVECRSNRAST